MVASRIRGITVEIGRDTTGLDKALKSNPSTRIRPQPDFENQSI